jgi:hypothetical protein
MKRIALGNTGLMVSAVGLGGIPLTRLAPPAAAALVRHALHAGINFFDSAYTYPDSEPRIGAGLRGFDRARFVVASKDASTDGAMFTAHAEESLARLGVEYLDLMQLHNVSDRATWQAVRAPGGAYEALLRLRDRGRARHVGVTCHNADLAAEMAESGLFETLQVPLNFIADEAAPLVARCARLGLGFIAMKPFAGGAVDDARLALGFLQQFPGVVPIPGIETTEELRQVVELYEAPRPLVAADRSRIDTLKRDLGTRFCHGCGYCQPCPQGIAIEMILRAESFARRLPLERSLRVLGRFMPKVDECLECGECLKKCPYHLEIPSLLRRSRQWYDEWLKTVPH